MGAQSAWTVVALIETRSMTCLVHAGAELAARSRTDLAAVMADSFVHVAGFA